MPNFKRFQLLHCPVDTTKPKTFPDRSLNLRQHLSNALKLDQIKPICASEVASVSSSCHFSSHSKVLQHLNQLYCPVLQVQWQQENAFRLITQAISAGHGVVHLNNKSLELWPNTMYVQRE